MTEAFYNVFDHAKAGNNAFSIIKYIEEDNKLHVAISDFGIGITRSVRSFLPSIKNDKEALKIAVKDKFTVGSTLRNRGFGLANSYIKNDNKATYNFYNYQSSNPQYVDDNNLDPELSNYIKDNLNIYPQYIENTIDSHPDVLLSCVIGIPHPYKQEVAKAFIV